MCSIVASFDKQKLKELVTLNQFRGNFSYSISVFGEDFNLIKQTKNFGGFNFDELDSFPDGYYICHVQAPTGGMVKDENRIHPVAVQDDFLWHNGILAPRGVKYLQKSLNVEENFDTELLAQGLNTSGWGELSNIEGLFSCLYVNKGKLYAFRTKHGKLYIDDDMNISSERFEGSKCINFDTIYGLDVFNKDILKVSSFSTLRFNYVIRGEL